MKHNIILIAFLLLSSCERESQTNETSLEIEQSIPENVEIKKYKPDYPIITFWHTIPIAKKFDRVHNTSDVNDLVVDTSSNYVAVSCDIQTSCKDASIEGYMYFNPKESDTVFLEYLIKCRDSVHTSEKQNIVRLFYTFTDGLTYESRPFKPRPKKE